MALSNLKNLSDLANVAKLKNGKEVLTVEVTDVVSKDQIRKKFEKIEELAETLLTEGQQSPIIVSPKNSEGKYVIQKGERRWRACQQAGLKTIDIIVNHKEQTSLDVVAGELIENIQREDLMPMEIAEALAVFLDDGWKQREIAKRIGKSEVFVSNHLGLLKAPEHVRHLHDAGHVLDVETLNILRMLNDIDESRCRVVCEAAAQEALSRASARDMLNDARRAQNEGVEPGQVIFDKKKPSSVSVTPAIVQAPTSKKAVGKLKHIGTSVSKDNWLPVRAEHLVFHVAVIVADELQRGEIMTDRVATDPEMVWVKVQLDGKTVPIHVRLDEVQLVSIDSVSTI